MRLKTSKTLHREMNSQYTQTDQNYKSLAPSSYVNEDNNSIEAFSNQSLIFTKESCLQSCNDYELGNEECYYKVNAMNLY